MAQKTAGVSCAECDRRLSSRSSLSPTPSRARWHRPRLRGSGMPIDVSMAEKKLREARFFLNALKAFRSASGPDDTPEDFDFCLSAFLGASNSVGEKLT